MLKLYLITMLLITPFVEQLSTANCSIFLSTSATSRFLRLSAEDDKATLNLFNSIMKGRLPKASFVVGNRSPIVTEIVDRATIYEGPMFTGSGDHIRSPWIQAVFEILIENGGTRHIHKYVRHFKNNPGTFYYDFATLARLILISDPTGKTIETVAKMTRAKNPLPWTKELVEARKVMSIAVLLQVVEQIRAGTSQATPEFIRQLAKETKNTSSNNLRYELLETTERSAIGIQQLAAQFEANLDK